MNPLVPWLWGRLPLSRRARARIIWLLSPKFTVGVVGLVRDSQDRVLLLKHTYRGRMPWGLPGGGLRSGESLEECLRRELREETGMEISIVGLISATSHSDRRLVDMIFECSPAAGAGLEDFTPNAEVSEARWFALSSLPPDMSRAQQRLIMLASEQRAEGRPVHYRSDPDLSRDDWP